VVTTPSGVGICMGERLRGSNTDKLSKRRGGGCRRSLRELVDSDKGNREEERRQLGLPSENLCKDATKKGGRRVRQGKFLTSPKKKNAIGRG